MLSSEVRVHSFAHVERSIILNGVEILEDCKIRNAIVDKHVILAPGTTIGYDRADDEQRYHVVDLDKDAGTWLTIIEKNHARVNEDIKTTTLIL